MWIFDRETKKAVSHGFAGPLEGVQPPANVKDGPARARGDGTEVDIDQVEGGTHIRASIPEASFDVFAARQQGHGRLAVVVPWDDVLFQYTVKDVCRPASGIVTTGDHTLPVPAGHSWAVLDHGRGRWPASVRWNWGSGCGRLADGRVIGLLVGGKWTDGTGSTENAMHLDRMVCKLIDELVWEYDTSDGDRPSGCGLYATLTPFYDKASSVSTLRIKSNTNQCFGMWDGTFDTGSEVVQFEELDGFAEDVTREW